MDARLLHRLTVLLDEYATLQHPERCHVPEVGFNALAAERDRQHAADLAAQFMDLAVAAGLRQHLTAGVAA